MKRIILGFVLLIMAGCGGGGSSSTAPTAMTPAEAAAAKLASLQQVQGTWLFSYSSPSSQNVVLKLSNVAITSNLILNPTYDYTVSVASTPAGNIFDAGYVNATSTWTIQDKTYYSPVGAGFITKYVFQTNATNTGLASGACAYLVDTGHGTSSACFPMTGTKTQ